ATSVGGGAPGGGGGLDTLVDWRLVVRPPLTLHNTLPVAGRYAVWERSRPGGPLRIRQQGRVEAGAAASVYSADMRLQVFLSFAPDGCEYGEPEPMLLSDGYMRNTAGVSAAPRLPDSFRCTYSHSASFTPLRINLLRDIDTSAASGLLGSFALAAGPATGRRGASGAPSALGSGALSPGEAVAQGYPLTVSLHVPLWLVNATQLPVSCGVLVVEGPPGEGERGGGTGRTDSAASMSFAAAQVRDLGSGVMQGGRAITRGLLSGAMGIITKPVEGAEQGGVSGFFEGLAKGIVGAAVNPVSGTLEAVSKVTEGVDATRRNLTGAMMGAAASAVGVRRLGVARKRLQRAFTGDNVLRPFSLHPALGQALLYSVAAWMGPLSKGGGGAGSGAEVGRSSGGLGGALGSSFSFAAGALPSSAVRSAASSRPDLRRDRYEEHWVLPRDVVLMITDRRVLAMQAPEFVALQSSVLSGETSHVTEVPAGDAVVLWQLPWPDMLSAELAWHNQPPQPQQRGRGALVAAAA
ncbi:Vacuolar protein sorting-associated protein 13C, partial [Tetrabaena socialis]